MRAQDGGGAGGGDGVIQCRSDGSGLVRSRNHADHRFCGHQRGIGQRDSLGGHRAKIREASVVDLLLPAPVVELHDFDRALVVELGGGRIAEGDVGVFSDSHAGEIYGGFREMGGVSSALGERILIFAPQAVEGCRMDLSEKSVDSRWLYILIINYA